MIPMFNNGRCGPAGHGYEHVFAEGDFGHYRICQCGERKKTSCRCDCGDSHQKEAETTADERVQHAILQINLRLSVLEQSVTGTTAPVRLVG